MRAAQRWMASSVLVVLLCAQGCRVGARHFEDDEKAALEALRVLHSNLDAGHLEKIYESSAEELKMRSKTDVLEAMQVTRERWGKVVRTQVRRTACFPGYVRIIAHTAFERGEATERVSWQIGEGGTRLLSYSASPGFSDVPSGTKNSCHGGA